MERMEIGAGGGEKRKRGKDGNESQNWIWKRGANARQSSHANWLQWITF